MWSARCWSTGLLVSTRMTRRGRRYASCRTRSTSNLKTFLTEVNDASQGIANKEYDLLLAYAQSQQPGLKNILGSDSGYWAEQYRRAKYDFDAQSVRPYFPYMQVQEGILTTAAHL